MSEPPETLRAEVDEERHANNLELFLDLVFVFAVTQIATIVGIHITAANLGKGTLVASLVWWQWSQFTWAGSAVDLQAQPSTRVLVLCTIPATLTMAAAIPASFERTGAWFGVSYLVVQLLVLGMQGAQTLADPVLRTSFAKYAVAATIAPCLVAVGGYLEGRARIVLWALAIIIDVVGAFRGAAGEWVINPVHFAERHALFVIISLGEGVVAIGASASAHGLTHATLAGLVVGSSVACVLWWTYFAFIPAVAEHKLRIESGPERGRVARNLFTLGHFPIVAGLIAYSVVAKHVVEHPFGRLGGSDRALLFAAITLVVAGYLHIQWQVRRRFAPERLIATMALGIVAIAGRQLHGSAILAITVAIIAAMQAVTSHRYARNPYAPAAPSTNR